MFSSSLDSGLLGFLLVQLGDTLDPVLGEVGLHLLLLLEVLMYGLQPPFEILDLINLFDLLDVGY